MNILCCYLSRLCRNGLTLNTRNLGNHQPFPDLNEVGVGVLCVDYLFLQGLTLPFRWEKDNYVEDTRDIVPSSHMWKEKSMTKCCHKGIVLSYRIIDSNACLPPDAPAIPSNRFHISYGYRSLEEYHSKAISAASYWRNADDVYPLHSITLKGDNSPQSSLLNVPSWNNVQSFRIGWFYVPFSSSWNIHEAVTTRPDAKDRTYHKLLVFIHKFDF